MKKSGIMMFFVSLRRRPPRSRRTDTLMPVTNLCRSLVADSDDERLPKGKAALETWLNVAGFGDAGAAAARVEDWRSWKARALRSQSARNAFETILPAFLSGIGGSPDPVAALQHFDRFLDRLPSGAQFFSLLEEIGRAHV